MSTWMVGEDERRQWVVRKKKLMGWRRGSTYREREGRGREVSVNLQNYP